MSYDNCNDTKILDRYYTLQKRYIFISSNKLLSGHANTFNSGDSVTSLDSISLLSAWSIIFCAFSHSFSSLLCQLPPTFNTVCHCLCLHISDFPPFVEYVCQCCKTSQNEKEVNQWFYQMMQATSSFCSPSSVLLPCI